MPQVNFAEVQDPQEGGGKRESVPAPPGTYVAMVVWVQARQAPKGEYWNMMLEVVQPAEHKGKIVFDGLSWAPGALPRTKKALACMGCDVTQPRDWQPDDVKNKIVRVTVEASGDPKYPTKCPYDAYSALTQEELDEASRERYGF